MSKHAPGPWKVNKITPEHFGVLCIQSDDARVCVLTTVHGIKNKADANLIAAAPSMLERLQDAQNAFDAAIALTPTGPARNRLCDKNIERIAVIAQATGEPS